MGGNYNSNYNSAANETFAPMGQPADEVDQFGRRQTSSSSSSSSSSASSKRGNRRLSTNSNNSNNNSNNSNSSNSSSKSSRMGSTVAVFVVFVINVILIFMSRGWVDSLLYLVCAVLIGGLRGFSKLPKRYLSAIGIVLLLAPLGGWCVSFFSVGSGGGDSGSSGLASSSSSSSSSASSSVASSAGATASTEIVLVPIYSTIQGSQPLAMHCPPRAVISSIDFASYGTPSSCLGWRSTTGCNPEGPRDNTSDLNCDQSVPSERSGFCECSDGSKRVLSTCNHPAFTCKQECERVVTCKGFRKTANCNPQKGAKDPTLVGCDEIIAPHISGFCECSNGTFVSHSTCDHDPFTCHQKCTEGAARWPPFAIDSTCHHQQSRPIIEQQCPTGRTSCALGPGWPESLFELNEHQGDHDPCSGKAGARRLHVRMTCTQRQQIKKRTVSIGEVCRSTTDAFKICMEHHIVAEALKCQELFTKVLECQSKTSNLM